MPRPAIACSTPVPVGGGTSFMAYQRFRCQVDGVTISESQVEFANEVAHRRGVADQVTFHHRNMLDTGLESGSLRGIWTDETTMYVDLSPGCWISVAGTSVSPVATTT